MIARNLDIAAKTGSSRAPALASAAARCTRLATAVGTLVALVCGPSLGWAVEYVSLKHVKRTGAKPSVLLIPTTFGDIAQHTSGRLHLNRAFDANLQQLNKSAGKWSQSVRIFALPKLTSPHEEKALVQKILKEQGIHDPKLLKQRIVEFREKRVAELQQVCKMIDSASYRTFKNFYVTLADSRVDKAIAEATHGGTMASLGGVAGRNTKTEQISAARAAKLAFELGLVSPGDAGLSPQDMNRGHVLFDSNGEYIEAAHFLSLEHDLLQTDGVGANLKARYLREMRCPSTGDAKLGSEVSRHMAQPFYALVDRFLGAHLRNRRMKQKWHHAEAALESRQQIAKRLREIPSIWSGEFGSTAVDFEGMSNGQGHEWFWAQEGTVLADFDPLLFSLPGFVLETGANHQMALADARGVRKMVVADFAQRYKKLRADEQLPETQEEIARKVEKGRTQTREIMPLAIADLFTPVLREGASEQTTEQVINLLEQIRKEHPTTASHYSWYYSMEEARLGPPFRIEDDAIQLTKDVAIAFSEAFSQSVDHYLTAVSGTGGLDAATPPHIDLTQAGPELIKAVGTHAIQGPDKWKINVKKDLPSTKTLEEWTDAS